jgi:hypothetical protein
MVNMAHPSHQDQNFAAVMDGTWKLQFAQMETDLVPVFVSYFICEISVAGCLIW